MLVPSATHVVHGLRTAPLLTDRVRESCLIRMRESGLISFATAIPQAYSAALVAAPLATKCASAAIVAIFADAIAQLLTQKGRTVTTWDWSRTVWIIVWGVVVSGCGNAVWLDFLSRLFPDARTNATELAKKVFVNQLFVAPVFNAGFFAFVIFTQMRPSARMNRAKWVALRSKLGADLWPTMVRGNLFWTCAQTINFKLLPPSLAVLATNIFSLMWTTYLAIVGNREQSALGRHRPRPSADDTMGTADQ
jgi:protein Mpv17